MAKSKLPDFEEVTKFAGKLFKDLKQSVNEICSQYKDARDSDDTAKAKPADEKPTKTSNKSESQPKDNNDSTG